MSDIHHEHVSHASEEKAHSALNKKLIWRVFWILLFITLFEVFFMHLKFEAIDAKYSLLLPFVLIVYLIFIALYEGTALMNTPY